MKKWLGTLAVVSAVSLSSAVIADSAVTDYNRDINAQIASSIYYPSDALFEESQGVVGLAVTIADGGQVTDVVVETSSGVQALDVAAVSAVRDAAPFAQAPAGGTVFHTKLKYMVKHKSAQPATKTAMSN